MVELGSCAKRCIGEKAYMFDFTQPLNNEFMVANQFTVIEHGVEKRPDVIVFVNGIPARIPIKYWPAIINTTR